LAHEELHSGVGLSAVAPAVFAGTVAITRFAIGGLKAAHARIVVLAGALAAAAGAALIAAASTLFIAGLGLAVAAAGTAVLFPTLRRRFAKRRRVPPGPRDVGRHDRVLPPVPGWSGLRRAVG
jgi:hypothetical protein